MKRISIAFVLVGLATGLSHGQQVVVTPQETDEILANPGMGWETFHGTSKQDKNLTDVDYDGFDWGDSPEAFRWNNHRKRFNDLTTFAAAVGIEQHGMRFREKGILEKWAIPPAPSRVAPQHLALKKGSTAVDAGIVVPNISSDFVGKASDLGAYELGGDTPHYGPRKE